MRRADDPRPLIAEGLWHGEIARAPRGANGFGYDPLFLAAGLGKTAAELDPAEKNRISHRALALAACWSSCDDPTIALERPGAVQLAVLPPLALYVHIPWCVRKCPYCDFNSHERSGRAARARVRRQIDARSGGGAALRLGPAGRSASSSAAARRACSRRRRSTRCSPACARACRSSPAPRSRWRRIPARSRRRASAASATPA